MNRGVSLVELMLSLTIGTFLILVLFSMYALISKGYRESRDEWYCMQSLRSAIAQIDADLKQCALLLPQDLKVACADGSLFIAGAPVTSGYPGISLHSENSPPYYSVVQGSRGTTISLDSLDVDSQGSPDYWADLGIISDSGAYVISHGYSRGTSPIPLKSTPRVQAGDRTVPSNHYELKEDGLYRNAQLLAEAIREFDARVTGNTLTIRLLASHNGEKKDISLSYHLQ
ncbi:MAG TPA: hypothetical protein PKM41_02880 [Deltaproteobacteria bacterium]|nr:hypothetical protein [Deltaproteobacteria bacterium]HOI05813.1 hypothetical protein [Deltaproteobacteria bacterium]